MFVWLHLYDPHDPYEPPAPYAARYADRPYDGEVAWSDELVGRVDAALARLGLRGETLLVVTSDHGEGLGDHGEEVHGFFVYESTLAVPLLMRGPGIPAGLRLPVTVRSVDVMPTLLDLVGATPSAARPSLRPHPGRRAARRCRPARGADLRGIAHAAAAFRVERPAQPARGALQVHPGAAPRAVRPPSGSAGAARPRPRRSGQGRRAPRRAGGAAGQRARGRPVRGRGGRRPAGAAREAGSARLRGGRQRCHRRRRRERTPRTSSKTTRW